MIRYLSNGNLWDLKLQRHRRADWLIRIAAGGEPSVHRRAWFTLLMQVCDDPGNKP